MKIKKYIVIKSLISLAIIIIIAMIIMVIVILNEEPVQVTLPKTEKIVVTRKPLRYKPERQRVEEFAPVKELETIEEPELINLGKFKLTAYCSCAKCCGKWAINRPKDENGNDIVYGASGKRLISNYSIAVDPKVIPYGTVVVIDGEEYEAMDCGGGIKGNRIDVYFDSHEEALKFAVRTTDVYMKAEITEVEE